jgi:hypothetical protein
MIFLSPTEIGLARECLYNYRRFRRTFVLSPSRVFEFSHSQHRQALGAHHHGSHSLIERHHFKERQKQRGHKNIMHTVGYTEMAPDRFKNFWRD